MSICAAKHWNNVATAYAISFVCTLSLPHLHEITSPSSECRSCWQLQLPQHLIIIIIVIRIAVHHQCGSYTSNNNHIQCRQNQMVFAYPHNSMLWTSAVFCFVHSVLCFHTHTHTLYRSHLSLAQHTNTHRQSTVGKLIPRKQTKIVYMRILSADPKTHRSTEDRGQRAI